MLFNVSELVDLFTNNVTPCEKYHFIDSGERIKLLIIVLAVPQHPSRLIGQ